MNNPNRPFSTNGNRPINNEQCIGPLCSQFNADPTTGGLTGGGCLFGNCAQLNFNGGSDGGGGAGSQECVGTQCTQINIGGGATSQGCVGAECTQLNIGDGGGIGSVFRPNRPAGSSNQGCEGSNCEQFNFGRGRAGGRI